jgi:virginiamycin B lyase
VNQNEDSVSLIEARTNSVRKTLSVGDVPTAVGLGEGAVWVANNGDGTVSRIDPETNEVVATISIGNRPQGIIVAQGLVWVTVRKA